MVRFNLQLFAKSVDAIAKEVIKGNWGNGDTRKTKLTNAGYDASAVQTRVNEMLGVGSKKTTTTPAPKATPTPAPVTKTPKNTPSTPEIKGVDSSLINTIGSKFEGSDDLAKLEQNYTGYGQDYLNFASNTDIISSDVMAGMSNPYTDSAAYLQASQLLQSKIDQGYAGTHKDALNNLLNEFMNREDFEYDVDKDQMFQQALASAMGSGKAAMQDTMGQAAALTGGYGSTYATTAGNQAYNAFIEDAYNNLPEYYNMALAAYQAEGQQMLQQYNMLDAADTKEYGQWYDEVGLLHQQARDIKQDDYNQWSANNTMYTNLANMQLSENAQNVSNLYNAYSVAADMYTTKYAQETQSWMQSIDSAYKLGTMSQNAYQHAENLDFQKDQANISQSNWEKSYAFDLASAGAKVDDKGNITVNKTISDNVYSASAKQKEEAKVAYEQGGTEGLENYIASQKDGIDVEELLSYVERDSLPSGTEIKKTDDTWNGIFNVGSLWGRVDTNDTFEVTYYDENGNPVTKTVKTKDLPKGVQERANKLKAGEKITW